MKKLLFLLFTCCIFIFNVKSQEATIDSGGIGIATSFVNPTIDACTDVLQQSITLTNNSGGPLNNYPIRINTLLNTIPVSGQGVTQISPQIYEISIGNLPNNQSTTLIINFALNCAFEAGGLFPGHSVSSDFDENGSFNDLGETSNAIEYTVFLTNLTSVWSNMPGGYSIGATAEFRSTLNLQSGSTDQLLLNINLGDQLNENDVDIRLKHNNGTVLFSCDNCPLNPTANNNEYTYNLNLSQWSHIQNSTNNNIRKLEVDAGVLDSCGVSTASVEIRNVCHSDSVGCIIGGGRKNETIRTNAAGTGQLRNIYFSDFITSTDTIQLTKYDICTKNPDAAFALRLLNEIQGASNTGHKAIEEYDFTIDMRIFQFDHITINGDTIITYNPIAPEGIESNDFTINPAYINVIEAPSVLNGTIVNGVVTFNFNLFDPLDINAYIAGDTNTTILTNTVWDPNLSILNSDTNYIFEWFYFVDSIPKFYGLSQGNYMDFFFEGFRYEVGNLTKTIGVKDNGIFASAGDSILFLNMCSNISNPLLAIYGGQANSSRQIGHAHVENICGQNIYWNRPAITADVSTTSGDYDLEAGQAVGLMFDFDEVLTLRNNYGATRFNPWQIGNILDPQGGANFGLGNYSKSFVQNEPNDFWSVITFGDDIIFEAGSNIAATIHYESITYQGINSCNYILNDCTAQPDTIYKNNLFPLSGNRYAFRIPASNCPQGNVDKIIVNVQADCPSINPCTTDYAPSPNSDVNLEIRSYRLCDTSMLSDTLAIIGELEDSTTQYFTTAYGVGNFLIHCQGFCSSFLGASRPWSIERSTLGWTDPTLTTLVSNTSDIRLDHVYPLDEVDLKMVGTIASYRHPEGAECTNESDLIFLKDTYSDMTNPSEREFLPILYHYSVPGDPLLGLFSLIDSTLIDITLLDTAGNQLLFSFNIPSSEINLETRANAYSCEQTIEYVFHLPQYINDMIFDSLLGNDTTRLLVNMETALMVNRMDSVPRGRYPLLTLSERFELGNQDTIAPNLSCAFQQIGSNYITCDPWTNNFTFLKPEIGPLTFQVINGASDQRFHACGAEVQLLQSLRTATLGDDWPNEHRPWMQWPDSIEFTIHNGGFDGLSPRHRTKSVAQGDRGGFVYSSPENFCNQGTFNFCRDFPGITQTVIGNSSNIVFYPYDTGGIADVKTNTAFNWRASESGTQSLTFFVRKTCEDSTWVEFLNDTLDFNFGPGNTDNQGDLDTSYQIATDYIPEDDLSMEDFSAPITATVTEIYINNTAGFTEENPARFQVDLVSPRFVENAWMSIDLTGSGFSIPDDGVNLTLIPLSRNDLDYNNNELHNHEAVDAGGEFAGVEHYQMYKDTLSDTWIAYIGAINTINYQRDEGFFTNQIVPQSRKSFYLDIKYDCINSIDTTLCDTNNCILETCISRPQVEFEIRTGWDCHSTIDEIYNRKYFDAGTGNISLDSIITVNRVAQFVNDVRNNDNIQTVGDWRNNTTLCGNTSLPSHQSFNPGASILSVQDDNFESEIDIDLCSSNTDNHTFSFTVSSTGVGNVSNISAQVDFLDGLFLNPIISSGSIPSSYLDFIDLDESSILSCDSSISFSNTSIVITELPLADLGGNAINDYSIIIQTEVLLVDSCRDVVFNIVFKDVSIQQSGEISVSAQGLDLCGNLKCNDNGFVTSQEGFNYQGGEYCKTCNDPSLYFDGRNDFVKIRVTGAARSTNDVFTQTQGFTLETWIRPDYEQGNRPRSTVFSRKNGSGDGISFGLTSDLKNLYFEGDNGTYVLSSTTIAGTNGEIDFSDGTCHHIAFAYSNGIGIFYFDGEPLSGNYSGNVSSTPNGNWQLRFGTNRPVADGAFKGEISDARLYDFVLTNQQIFNNYEKNLFVNTSPPQLDDGLFPGTLVGYWKMDEGPLSQTVIDQKGQWPLLLTNNLIWANGTLGGSIATGQGNDPVWNQSCSTCPCTIETSDPIGLDYDCANGTAILDLIGNPTYTANWYHLSNNPDLLDLGNEVPSGTTNPYIYQGPGPDTIFAQGTQQVVYVNDTTTQTCIHNPKWRSVVKVLADVEIMGDSSLCGVGMAELCAIGDYDLSYNPPITWTPNGLAVSANNPYCVSVANGVYTATGHSEAYSTLIQDFCPTTDTFIVDLCTTGDCAGLEFDGNNDQVIIGNVANQNMYSKDFTLEARILPIAQSNNTYDKMPIITRRINGMLANNNQNGISFGIEEDLNRLYFIVGNGNFHFNSNGNTNKIVYSDSIDIKDDKCHYVAVTREKLNGTDNNNSLITFYVDGVQIGTTQPLNHGNFLGYGAIRIGRGIPYVNGRKLSFQGEISEVRIWDYAQSPAEILSNIFAPIIDPLELNNMLGYWPMQEGSGQAIFNHAPLVNWPIGKRGHSVNPDNAEPSWETGCDACECQGEPLIAEGDSICTDNSTMLTASGVTGSDILGPIEWYDDNIGTNQLEIGPDFTTPVLTSTTTYYVGNCNNNPPHISDPTLPAPIAVVVDVSEIELTSFTITNVNCFGAMTGSIDITVSNGLGAYTYSWTGPNGFTSNQEDLVNLPEGIYQVTVNDVIACNISQTFTITEPDSINLTTQITNVSCKNNADGLIEILNIIGGTAPYSFLWNGPNVINETTSLIDNLGPGNYNLVITDDSLCTKSYDFVITEPDSLLLDSVILINQTCTTLGAITAHVSGGTLPYSYNWTGPSCPTNCPANANTISNLQGGQYSVTVSDLNGCQVFEDSIIIDSILNPINVLASVSNETCLGNNDGSIDLTISQLAPPYSIMWNDGPTSEDRSNLAPGTYYVLIQDFYGCSIADTFIIGSGNTLSVDDTIIQPSCSPGNDGSIDITVIGTAGAYTYQWDDDLLSTTQDLTGLDPGTYSVSITDTSGCTTVGGPYIIECQCCPDPELASVDWIYYAVDHADINNNVSTFSVFNAIPNLEETHALSQMDLRIWDGSGAIHQYDVLADGTISYLFGTNPAYLIDHDWGTFTPDTLDYYLYELDVFTHDGLEYHINSSFNINSSNLVDDQLLTIIQNPTIADDTLACPFDFIFYANRGDNATNLDFDVTSADINFNAVEDSIPDTLTWSQADAFVFDLGQSFVVDQFGYNISILGDVSITGTYAGNYTQSVFYPIRTSCSVPCDTLVEITQSCIDSLGNVTLTASGGFASYDWLPAGNTQSITVSASGQYQVNVTGTNGCVSSASIIPNNSVLTVSEIVVNESCNPGMDGSIDLTVSGGIMPYSYQWSGASSANSEDLSNLSAGSYTITVTDSSACASFTKTIEVQACIDCDTVLPAEMDNVLGNIIFSSDGTTGSLSFDAPPVIPQEYTLAYSTDAGLNYTVIQNPVMNPFLISNLDPDGIEFCIEVTYTDSITNSVCSVIICEDFNTTTCCPDGSTPLPEWMYFGLYTASNGFNSLANTSTYSIQDLGVNVWGFNPQNIAHIQIAFEQIGSGGIGTGVLGQPDTLSSISDLVTNDWGMFAPNEGMYYDYELIVVSSEGEFNLSSAITRDSVGHNQVLTPMGPIQAYDPSQIFNCGDMMSVVAVPQGGDNIDWININLSIDENGGGELPVLVDTFVLNFSNFGVINTEEEMLLNSSYELALTSQIIQLEDSQLYDHDLSITMTSSCSGCDLDARGIYIVQDENVRYDSLTNSSRIKLYDVLETENIDLLDVSIENGNGTMVDYSLSGGDITTGINSGELYYTFVHNWAFLSGYTSGEYKMTIDAASSTSGLTFHSEGYLYFLEEDTIGDSNNLKTQIHFLYYVPLTLFSTTPSSEGVKEFVGVYVNTEGLSDFDSGFVIVNNGTPLPIYPDPIPQQAVNQFDFNGFHDIQAMPASFPVEGTVSEVDGDTLLVQYDLLVDCEAEDTCCPNGELVNSHLYFGLYHASFASSSSSMIHVDNLSNLYGGLSDPELTVLNLNIGGQNYDLLGQVGNLFEHNWGTVPALNDFFPYTITAQTSDGLSFVLNSSINPNLDFNGNILPALITPSYAGLSMQCNDDLLLFGESEDSLLFDNVVLNIDGTDITIYDTDNDGVGDYLWDPIYGSGTDYYVGVPLIQYMAGNHAVSINGNAAYNLNNEGVAEVSFPVSVSYDYNFVCEVDTSEVCEDFSATTVFILHLDTVIDVDSTTVEFFFNDRLNTEIIDSLCIQIEMADGSMSNCYTGSLTGNGEVVSVVHDFGGDIPNGIFRILIYAHSVSGLTYEADYVIPWASGIFVPTNLLNGINSLNDGQNSFSFWFDEISGTHSLDSATVLFNNTESFTFEQPTGTLGSFSEDVMVDVNQEGIYPVSVIGADSRGEHFSYHYDLLVEDCDEECNSSNYDLEYLLVFPSNVDDLSNNLKQFNFGISENTGVDSIEVAFKVLDIGSLQSFTIPVSGLGSSFSINYDISEALSAQKGLQISIDAYGPAGGGLEYHLVYYYDDDVTDGAITYLYPLDFSNFTNGLNPFIILGSSAESFYDFDSLNYNLDTIRFPFDGAAQSEVSDTVYGNFTSSGLTNISVLSVDTNGYVMLMQYTLNLLCDQSLKTEDTQEELLNDDDSLQSDIRIYPNPAKDAFTIELAGFNETYSVQVFNSLGQQVYRNNFMESKVQVDILQWNTGIYIVQIIDANGVQIGNRKLMVLE